MPLCYEVKEGKIRDGEIDLDPTRDGNVIIFTSFFELLVKIEMRDFCMQK